MHTLILAAAGLLPVRLPAIVALAAVIFAFVYVLRHLKMIEAPIVTDNLAPAQRGPRNMVLIICAVPIVVVTLLVFLIITT